MTEVAIVPCQHDGTRLREHVTGGSKAGALHCDRCGCCFLSSGELREGAVDCEGAQAITEEGMAEAVADLLAGKAKSAIERVEASDHLELLQAALEVEERVTVQRSLEERVAVLSERAAAAEPPAAVGDAEVDRGLPGVSAAEGYKNGPPGQEA